MRHGYEHKISTHRRQHEPRKNLALLSIESWLFNKDPYVMVDEIILIIFLGSIIPCMIKQPVVYPKW